MTEQGLIAELCERSAKHCTQRHVLCIQDTTEMNFYSHRHRIKEDTGFGRLDAAKPSLGFKMHSTLIIDAFNSDILGFSNLQLWHRPLDQPDRKQRRYQTLPIEEKESYKWIKAANESKSILSEASMITFIEDREGDIYEQLSSIADIPANVHYIIRSKTNRNTTDGIKVWDLLKSCSPVGSYTIKIPTDYRKGRKKADVKLEIRYSSVSITKGSHTKNGKLYPCTVPLTAVEAYEENGNGISWKLLTTHAINSFEDACRIIEWYSDRWLIEQVHRLLKTQGFQVEDSELETGWAVRKLCVLMLSALLRILQMNLAYSDPEGGQPITEVFSDEEIQCLTHLNKKLQGKTIKLKNHNDPSVLKWATWIIARLGGWQGYDSQRPPGIILLKRGLDKFCNVFYGWKLAIDVGTQ